MSVALSPIGNGFQFFTSSGIPLAGGLLNTYNAGGSTPTATYTSSTGGTPNANPIVLDAAGRPPNEIWLTDGTAYKFVLTDSLGANALTYDNLTGIGNVLLGLTPQLASNNAFTGTNSFAQAVTMASTLAVSGISSTLADFKVTTAGHGILGPDGGRYLTVNNSAVSVTGTLAVSSATTITDSANENVFNISPTHASFSSAAILVNTTRDANSAFSLLTLKANTVTQLSVSGVGVLSVQSLAPLGASLILTGLNSFTNTTDSGNSTAGAVVVSGGIGVAKSVSIGTGFGARIGGAANRSVTGPTNFIDIFNGSAPSGTLAGGVTLYATGGKLFAMDAGGTPTQLTP